MPGQLEGKVMLVTGGASGIGRATALACAREGAKLILADLQEEGGHHTVHLITAKGGEARFVQADVTHATEVEALISKAVARYGRLDCAHNNAGISGRGIAGDHRALTAEYPDERWHQVIAINLTGVWLCMKYELQQMLTQGGGAIVNTASAAGLVAVEQLSAYNASKHGVVGLTKTAALEFAQKNIRVNCVCPGLINTPMVARMVDSGGMNEQDFIAAEPVARMGKPEEIGEGVVWLLSEGASFVTGHSMSIDGGYVAQ